MIAQKLHQGWTMELGGRGEKLPATVPGSVYSCLLDAGKMEDPCWRDNETKALALLENDCVWQVNFVPQAEILNCPHQVLRLEGVDTVADIRLNGRLQIGRAHV